MSGNRLETESVRGLFWSMALPVILQQLLLLLNNVVDRIWIAHIPDVGQLAFTASAVCVPIIYMMMALSELVGTGIASRVGYHLGQGNSQRAEQTLGSFFLFDMLLAVLVCGVIEWQCCSLIKLFGGSDQTVALSELYLRISTPSNALCIVSGGLAPFLLAQGRSREAGMDDETQAGELYLDSLAVLPAYRRQGIAQRLLIATKERAQLLHLPRVGLLVDKGNPDGEALYTKVGFVYLNDNQWGGHPMKHLVLPCQRNF